MKKVIEYVRERGTSIDEQTARDLKALKDIEVLPPDEIENVILPAICALYEGVKVVAKNGFRLSREDSHTFTIAVFAESNIKDMFVYGCGLDLLIRGTQVFNKASKLEEGGSFTALHQILTFENLKFIESVRVTARLPVPLRWQRLAAFDREILEYRYLRGMDCRTISKEHENYGFGKILDSNSVLMNHLGYPYLKSIEQEEREERQKEQSKEAAGK